MDIEIPQRHFLREKLIRLGVAIAVAMVLALIAYQFLFYRPSVSAESIQVAPVERGTVTEYVEAIGYLRSDSQKQVISKVPGVVEEVLVHAGQTVQADTPLVRLQNPELIETLQRMQLAYQQEVTQLQEFEREQQGRLASLQGEIQLLNAELDVAKSKYAAVKDLAADGLISKLELQRIKADLDKSKLQVDLARAELERERGLGIVRLQSKQLQVKQAEQELQIARRQVQNLTVAPGYSGVIDSVNPSIELGSSVAVGESIARVSKLNELSAMLSVPASRANKLQVGDLVRLNLADQEVLAEVNFIDRAVKAGRVWLNATMVEATPLEARPDMEITADIRVQEKHNVLYLPRTPYLEPQSTQQLFHLSGGTLSRVDVDLGIAGVGRVEVLSGLSEGSRVVVSNAQSFNKHLKVDVD